MIFYIGLRYKHGTAPRKIAAGATPTISEESLSRPEAEDSRLKILDSFLEL